MGSGSNKGQQSMQMQIEQKQKKQVKSTKYQPFSENEIQSLQKKFKTLDENSRGSITLDEFKNLLEIRMHFFRDRIYNLIQQDMLKQINLQQHINNSRKNLATMNFDLFINYLQVFHPSTDYEQKMKYMFKLYDFDGDGVVTEKDLQEVFELIYMKSASTLKPPSKRPTVFQTDFMSEDFDSFVKRLGKDVMNMVDEDQSKSIEYEEFVKIFTDTDIQFRMNIVY